MRRKLLTALVAACALTGVLVGPASASAATLTLNNSLEEPAKVANFPDGTGLEVQGTSLACETFALQSEITKNAADPVTLKITGANISGCTVSGFPLEYSEIQSNYMKLNANGTGQLHLKVKETSKIWTCEREGILNLTYTEGKVTASGEMMKTSGTVFCFNVHNWKTTFSPATDEFSSPIDWVITP